MKKILIAAALIVSGLLSGCNQLTQYTVSEQEINQGPAEAKPFRQRYWSERRCRRPYRTAEPDQRYRARGAGQSHPEWDRQRRS